MVVYRLKRQFSSLLYLRVLSNLRMAVLKENAKHTPMKWPIGLSIKVTFFSVTPITWKGFIQSFEVEEPIRLSRSPDRKRFFLCKEKVRKSKKKTKQKQTTTTKKK